jgi:translation initiation factor eIF-2B subunit delta
MKRLGLRSGCLWHHFFFLESRPPSFFPTTHIGPLLVKHIASASTMAEPVQSAPMPSASSSSAPGSSQQSAGEKPQQPQTLPIRDSKGANATNSDKAPPKGTDAASSGPAVGGDGAGDKPLTPAELKKKAKAEKAARRAKEKLEREGPGGGAGPAGGAPAASAAGSQPRPSATPKKNSVSGGSQKGQKAPPPRRGSGAIAQTGAAEQQKKKEDKSVAVFGHLYGQRRRTTIAGAGKEVHPAVLALGLQMRDYVVCGSSARCVATLLAFKRVSLSSSPCHFIGWLITHGR